jgi:uncharacterized protein YhhL (DUF1145 family)
MAKVFMAIAQCFVGLLWAVILLAFVLPVLAAFIPVVFGLIGLIAALSIVFVVYCWIMSKYGKATFKRKKGSVYVSTEPDGK